MFLLGFGLVTQSLYVRYLEAFHLRGFSLRSGGYQPWHLLLLGKSGGIDQERNINCKSFFISSLSSYMEYFDPSFPFFLARRDQDHALQLRRL